MKLFLLRNSAVKDSISVWFPKAREWRYMSVDEFRQYKVTQEFLEARKNG